MNYTKKRYFTYLIITLFVMGSPFITIDGNHLLLLSFEKTQFHFMGYLFNVDELFVMPFLLIFLFIGIFAITAMFGRVWCGWACPQTIFRVIYRDFIEGKLLGLNRLKNKQKEADLNKAKNMIKKILAVLIWSLLSLIASINFILYFVPVSDFLQYIQTPSEHLVMIGFIVSIAGFLIFDIVLMKEAFCVYVCPYSRVQSVLYDNDTKQVVYNTNRGGEIYQNGEKSITNIKEWIGNEECTTCEACVKVCPTHIDIRKGFQVECINCLECSDACSTVMSKQGKDSLIYWGSTNSVLHKIKTTLFTKRNNMYFVALALSVLLAIIATSKQEPIIAHVNKTTKLFSIKENNEVTNNYIITLHNNKNKPYTYSIVLEDKRFAIKRYNAVKINGGKTKRSILILNTKEKLNLHNTQNTILKLKGKIVANEDKTISINKEFIFIYPSNDNFK